MIQNCENIYMEIDSGVIRCCQLHRDEFIEMINDTEMLSNHDCRCKYGITIREHQQKMESLLGRIDINQFKTIIFPSYKTMQTSILDEDCLK